MKIFILNESFRTNENTNIVEMNIVLVKT